MSSEPPQATPASTSRRRVVLVDGEDVPRGVAGIDASHDLPSGDKHRAFTAVLWDPEGRLLLAQRAVEKRLWPGCWDGTVASHPGPGESQVESAERRIQEELGVHCALAEYGRFDYSIADGPRGAENEVCATLVGQLGPKDRIHAVPSEVAAVRAMELPSLLQAIEATPLVFCPWMFLALVVLGRDVALLPASLAGHARALAGPAAAAALERALDAHFPRTQSGPRPGSEALGAPTWRLLEDD